MAYTSPSQVVFDKDEMNRIRLARLCMILHKLPSEIENEEVGKLADIYQLWVLDQDLANRANRR